MTTLADHEREKTVRLDILEAMLKLENERGHLAWKVADLARAAGVSRALVYYHFGRTKEEILAAGIDVIAEEYFGLTSSRSKLLEQGQGWDSVARTRAMIAARPSFAIFYLRWRSQKSTSIGKRLAAIDKRYEAMLARAFPKLSAAQITALHTILYGVVTAPFADDDAIAIVRALVMRL